MRYFLNRYFMICPFDLVDRGVMLYALQEYKKMIGKDHIGPFYTIMYLQEEKLLEAGFVEMFPVERLEGGLMVIHTHYRITFKGLWYLHCVHEGKV